MGETRETHIERDADGRVTDTKVTIDRPRRNGGGFGAGLLLGIVALAAVLLAFAWTEGSFQSAGREADRATAAAEQQLEQRAAEAQQALNDARASVDQAEQNSGTESN